MNAVFDLLGSTLLVERLCGVAVYCLALGYFCNKVGHAGDTRTVDRHLNSYLAVLGIMAFFYIPSPNADLYRWRLLSAGWSEVPFSWVWDNLVLKRATPVGYLLIYLCQITNKIVLTVWRIYSKRENCDLLTVFIFSLKRFFEIINKIAVCFF